MPRWVASFQWVGCFLKNRECLPFLCLPRWHTSSFFQNTFVFLIYIHILLSLLVQEGLIILPRTNLSYPLLLLDNKYNCLTNPNTNWELHLPDSLRGRLIFVCHSKWSVQLLVQKLWISAWWIGLRCFSLYVFEY